MVEAFRKRGWALFAADARVADWAGNARIAARAAVEDPALAQWHVCEGTWFVGVDALDNDARGRVGRSGPLVGPAVDFINTHLGGLPDLHKGQVSVVWPGYPRARTGEGAAGLRYRRNRDGAHLDGLKPIGPDRRRMIHEPHAFILGIPLSAADEGASPLVVWEGSHVIMQRALRKVLEAHAPDNWHNVDVTEAYTRARREVFDTCPRVVVHGRVGQACLVHRLAVHGMAPWRDGARADQDGRVIAYFRPLMKGGVKNWLSL